METISEADESAIGVWLNLANTPIFGQPNNNLSSGAVGSITSLASDSRAMQFALRLGF